MPFDNFGRNLDKPVSPAGGTFFGGAPLTNTGLPQRRGGGPAFVTATGGHTGFGLKPLRQPGGFMSATPAVPSGPAWGGGGGGGGGNGFMHFGGNSQDGGGGGGNGFMHFGGNSQDNWRGPRNFYGAPMIDATPGDAPSPMAPGGDTFGRLGETPGSFAPSKYPGMATLPQRSGPHSWELPGFANGGYPQDGTSVVGENGPELLQKEGEQVRIVPLPPDLQRGPTPGVLELKNGQGWSVGGDTAYQTVPQPAPAPVPVPPSPTMSAAPDTTSSTDWTSPAAAPAPVPTVPTPPANLMDSNAFQLGPVPTVPQPVLIPPNPMAAAPAAVPQAPQAQPPAPLPRVADIAQPPNPMDRLTHLVNPAREQRYLRQFMNSPQGMQFKLNTEMNRAAAAQQMQAKASQFNARQGTKEAQMRATFEAAQQRLAQQHEHFLTAEQNKLTRTGAHLDQHAQDKMAETQRKNDLMAVELNAQQARLAAMVKTGIIDDKTAEAYANITDPKVLNTVLEHHAKQHLEPAKITEGPNGTTIIQGLHTQVRGGEPNKTPQVHMMELPADPKNPNGPTHKVPHYVQIGPDGKPTLVPIPVGSAPADAHQTANSGFINSLK